MKYKFVYVYVPRYEGEGRIWAALVDRLVASLVIFQLTVIGLMLLKAASLQVR